MLEFGGFRQDDILLCVFRHGARCFGAHEIVGHETGLIPSVNANEEFIDVEVSDAGLNHGSDHDLRLVLVFSAEQNDMCIWLLADISCDKGRIGDDRDIAPVAGQLFGQKRAAAAGFNHHGFPVMDGFGCPVGDPPLPVIIKRKMIANIVAGDHGGEAMFPAKEPFLFEKVQVLADGDLRNLQFLCQFGNGNPFSAIDDIEQACMAHMHGLDPCLFVCSNR